jgi:hypothetical protein
MAMAGLGTDDQKSAAHATTPIATAFKTCISHRKNGLLNRLPAKVSFSILTRFLYREVTSPQPARAPKMRFGDETFLFFAKVVLGHDGFVWGFLRWPIPEKEVGESELLPWS